MSNELAKLLAYYMWVYIKTSEIQLGVEWPVPEQALVNSQINLGTWDQFWS